MVFRAKVKTKLFQDERQTVDAKHNNTLNSFIEHKSYLPVLQEELVVIIKEINKLNEENNNSMILNLSLQKNIWKLDDKKRELEKSIYDIKNNTEENAYMLKTGKILSEYYKIIEQEKTFTAGKQTSKICNLPKLSNNIVIPSIMSINHSNDKIFETHNIAIPTNIILTEPSQTQMDTTETTNTTTIDIKSELEKNTLSINKMCDIDKEKKTKNIIDWFSQSYENPIVFENIDTGKKITSIKKKKTLNEFKTDIKHIAENTFNKEKIASKDVVYVQYMKAIDTNYINFNNSDNDIFDTCTKCMVEMLLNNNIGVLICPKCGLMENIIVDSDKPSFKEPPKEMTSFCYKRINHLNEFLAQFQAKETTDIPEDVYNEIIMEIKKERISNMVLITPEKMRILLKRIKKNDYYEHIPYIINQLNGLPAPVIAPEIEEIIRGMFKAIQIPFEKYCPQQRKNFLSYNYVMYKFFELLELDEYLTCFQLLKSRTKLHQQDQIWKNICTDLNWEYIRSL